MDKKIIENVENRYECKLTSLEVSNGCVSMTLKFDDGDVLSHVLSVKHFKKLFCNF